MGKKHALIPLTLLAALGAAGCQGTQPVEEPEPVATFQTRYLAETSLVFEGEIDGETVREYEESEHIYIEVVKEDGSSIIYADNGGWGVQRYNYYIWDDFFCRKLEEVIFLEDGEVRIYDKYGAKVIKDEEDKLYPEPGYHSKDFGVPVMKLAQKQFREYLKKIDNYDYDSTLEPLQDWALDRLDK